MAAMASRIQRARCAINFSSMLPGDMARSKGHAGHFFFIWFEIRGHPHDIQLILRLACPVLRKQKLTGYDPECQCYRKLGNDGEIRGGRAEQIFKKYGDLDFFLHGESSCGFNADIEIGRPVGQAPNRAIAKVPRFSGSASKGIDDLQIIC